MLDVLEPDLSVLGRLKTRHLAAAVPCCRWRELGADGDAWAARRSGPGHSV